MNFKKSIRNGGAFNDSAGREDFLKMDSRVRVTLLGDVALATVAVIYSNRTENPRNETDAGFANYLLP